MNSFPSMPRRLRVNISVNPDPMNLKLARRALSFFLWVIVPLSPTRSFAQELLRVPYGVTTPLQHLPILAGKDTGLFSKYGLNAEPVPTRGGARFAQLLLTAT